MRLDIVRRPKLSLPVRGHLDLPDDWIRTNNSLIDLYESMSRLEEVQRCVYQIAPIVSAANFMIGLALCCGVLELQWRAVKIKYQFDPARRELLSSDVMGHTCSVSITEQKETHFITNSERLLP